jgi:peroxiredoxin-like protein
LADIPFGIEASWEGTGREGAGVVRTGGQAIEFSAPAAMGGRGVGTSPEELLLSGITACYSATLFGVLTRAHLPVSKLLVKTEGFVHDYPSAAKFDELTVNPTILGGDAAREDEYREQAEEARRRCFVGKTVAGNMTYRLGEVKVEP